jgi:hypothetical protein
VVVGAVLSAFVVVRRRRRRRRRGASQSNAISPFAAAALSFSRNRNNHSSHRRDKDIEDGAFRRYLSPRRAPALSHRLDEDVLSDDDDDLVDVLDLFDPPAAAHLRSPGPRKLSIGGGGFTSSTTTSSKDQKKRGWGPEWRFLMSNTSKASSPSQPMTVAPQHKPIGTIPHVLTMSSTSNASDAGDKMGLRTMLGASVASSSPPSYASRAPVLIPRNLDSPAAMATTKSTSSSSSKENNRRSIIRDKRPPPLVLHSSSRPVSHHPNQRASYITVTGLQHHPQYQQHRSAQLPKPPLSPITPLLTPPPQSLAAAIRSPMYTRSPAKAKPVIKIGDDTGRMPQELIRRSTDASW